MDGDGLVVVEQDRVVNNDFPRKVKALERHIRPISSNDGCVVLGKEGVPDRAEVLNGKGQAASWVAPMSSLVGLSVNLTNCNAAETKKTNDAVKPSETCLGERLPG